MAALSRSAAASARVLSLLSSLEVSLARLDAWRNSIGPQDPPPQGHRFSAPAVAAMGTDATWTAHSPSTRVTPAPSSSAPHRAPPQTPWARCWTRRPRRLSRRSAWAAGQLQPPRSRPRHRRRPSRRRPRLPARDAAGNRCAGCSPRRRQTCRSWRRRRATGRAATQPSADFLAELDAIAADMNA